MVLRGLLPHHWNATLKSKVDDAIAGVDNKVLRFFEVALLAFRIDTEL